MSSGTNGLSALTFSVLLVAACAPAQRASDSTPADSVVRAPGMAAGGVQLTLDRSTYRPGAPVTLRLVNGTSRTFGFNACTRTIERERDGEWAPFPEPDRICTMELHMLEPDANVTAQTELPGNIGRGTYRVSLALSDESASPGGPQRAVSGTFTID